ncbi:MAG TPA: phosphotransferase [Ktedonobacterales bacterium]
MPSISVDQLREYLRRQSVAELSGSIDVRPNGALPDEQRFALASGSGRYECIVFAPSAAERARRMISGLRLAGSVNLAPVLVLADEAGAALGGPVVVASAPGGASLGDRQLNDEEVQGWLFLLLTLHHLAPASVGVVSEMSPDAAAWWQRSQAAWETVRGAYSAPPFQPLVETLTRLRAIASVRLETNRQLWEGIQRRPCHGNPVPANLVRMGGRLMLIEWESFGLGDPAMDVGRAAALATLTGELTPEQYIRFVSDYLAGMRDTRDTTLEERLRVFSSVLPLGFCFALLGVLAQARGMDRAERARHVEQVARALQWIHETLGIEVGDIAGLVAPLRG